MNEINRPWYKELNRYHWFVLVVAALGWIFDCLDQQLFVLARPAAMKELVVESENLKGAELNTKRAEAGGFATSVFLAGWATGGLFFGMLGDRIGRAKTMLITILMYSAFTGLSALSRGVWDFCFYRFLTGLGVGGEFAVGVALVAEVMPSRARPYCLALLQALSALGNISAASIFWFLSVNEEEGAEWSPWRIMFIVGALPALLALVIRAGLKEPEQWQQTSHKGEMSKKLGSYAMLFQDSKLRKHALLGLLLACSGVIGLWAIGFFTPDLMRIVQRKKVAPVAYDQLIAEAKKDSKETVVAQLEKLKKAEIDPKLKIEVTPEMADLKKSAERIITKEIVGWQAWTSVLTNLGAFFGMFGFGAISQRIGRKPTFAIALVLACISTASVFWFLSEVSQLWLVFVMGFCQLSLFAGYAMYFPELFPTHLRSTGTSFCYNVGRFVAAIGPFIQGKLIAFFTELYKDSSVEPMRLAGVTLCVVFLMGLLVLPFLPETKGQPLPE